MRRLEQDGAKISIGEEDKELLVEKTVFENEGDSSSPKAGN